MAVKLQWAKKTNILRVWKEYFSVFCKSVSDELETIFGESEAKPSNSLNENLIKGSFLENDFEATLTSKINVLSDWKRHFLFFCKFLSDEVETIFSESEGNRLNIFTSKFGHRKLVRESLWGCLQLKNECCERFKRAFLSFFCKFLNHKVVTIWKWGKGFKST